MKPGQSGAAARRHRQRGFTLIELMVALAVSSILVIMVLSVFSRLSGAYRRQQQVSALQVILAAAQNLLAQDVRQAGFQLADGFRIAADSGNLQRPVRILNSATGPDELRLYSADAVEQAKVVSLTDTQVTIESAAQFVDGELAVIVHTGTTTIQVDGAARTIADLKACVVRLTLVGGTNLSLDSSPPWGNAGNLQCAEVRTAHDDGDGTAEPPEGQTMIYRFRARAYRIDPARPALGVLQLSPSGALIANDWQDLGVGFADLQVAARMFFSNDVADDDADGDAEYDWYSGAAMQTNTDPGAGGAPRITRLSVSVSARTDRTVDGVATAATPAFIEVARPSNNQLGDRPSVVLDPADRIYRYTTLRVDMRNTGASL